jgi:hypothetical protein
LSAIAGLTCIAGLIAAIFIVRRRSAAAVEPAPEMPDPSKLGLRRLSISTTRSIRRSVDPSHV